MGSIVSLCNYSGPIDVTDANGLRFMCCLWGVES